MARRSVHGAVWAGAAYFAIIFAARFALGVQRVLVLIPWLSPSRSEIIAVLIELPVILTISWIVCGGLISPLSVTKAVTTRLQMGTLALALLLTAEFLLETLGLGRTFSEQIHRYRKPPELMGLLGRLRSPPSPLSAHKGEMTVCGRCLSRSGRERTKHRIVAQGQHEPRTACSRFPQPLRYRPIS